MLNDQPPPDSSSSPPGQETADARFRPTGWALLDEALSYGVVRYYVAGYFCRSRIQGRHPAGGGPGWDTEAEG
ncbi:hypothetical protein [Streptomyces sp. NPDC093099]|uniref:hypothetical protein n=1 Tax=Streptomyces sp. NPDC093099 TaxID=3366028 RepID=UPI00382DD46E